MRQRRSGFTLIELLIVVVIIGVLAAIAIPKFQNTKGKANLAAIKSDLRNLATAEEAYFYTNGTYTSSLASLNVHPSPGPIPRLKCPASLDYRNDGYRKGTIQC